MVGAGVRAVRRRQEASEVLDFARVSNAKLKANRGLPGVNASSLHVT